MPTSEIIKIKNARLSFPRLFKARSFREGQEPRFEATFLLDPSNAVHAATIEQVEFMANEIAIEHWGTEKKIPKTLVECFGLAADEKPPLEYDGYEGMYFLRTAANLKNPPVIVDQGRVPLEIDERGVEPRIPYAGCYVNGTITLWVMDNEFGNRINANLRIVQFAKDGDAFGAAAPNVEEEIDILDDDDDGDDFLGD